MPISFLFVLPFCANLGAGPVSAETVHSRAMVPSRQPKRVASDEVRLEEAHERSLPPTFGFSKTANSTERNYITVTHHPSEALPIFLVD